MNHRIQRYLRAAVERTREPVPAGAFVLYLHPHSRHPFANYAIPADEARIDDGAALAAAARERGLVPRLEYIEPCFPALEQALAPSGFTREGRLRLMSCIALNPVDAPAGVELVEVGLQSPLVADTLAATNAAFGDGPPSDADVAAWPGRGVAALIDGQVVGGASWTTVIDGITEIAGVGVLEPMRRNGIGGALTAAAVRAAFEAGATLAVLTPGDDATARVYERAGFTDTTTMLHLRVPD
jgi:GNAT superfamily N-acetyltransferase